MTWALYALVGFFLTCGFVAVVFVLAGASGNSATTVSPEEPWKLKLEDEKRRELSDITFGKGGK